MNQARQQLTGPLPELPPEEPLPRPFGGYLLLQLFARGGMGEVYLARPVRTDAMQVEQYCVLKKLRPELNQDSEYVGRFIDEARVVVQLDHPAICHVFDVGRVGNEHFLAMEYVSGCDIKGLYERGKERGEPMPQAAALYLISEMARALDHAHRSCDQKSGQALQLVHRDISPQNVMISYQGEVKLIDFGLASSVLKTERTLPNVVMGKMAYMSPEQARGDAIDFSADLFAVAVVAYEILLGARFYGAMSHQEIWNTAGRGGFIPPQWQALPRPLRKILTKAIDATPKNRHKSCGAFADDLDAYLDKVAPGANRSTLRSVVSEWMAPEIAVEDQRLGGFAQAEVAFEDALEQSASMSVTLVRPAPVELPPLEAPLLAEMPDSAESTLLVGEGDSDIETQSEDVPVNAAFLPPRFREKIHDETTQLQEQTELVARKRKFLQDVAPTVVVRGFEEAPHPPRRSLFFVAALASIVAAIAAVAGMALYASMAATPLPSSVTSHHSPKDPAALHHSTTSKAPSAALRLAPVPKPAHAVASTPSAVVPTGARAAVKARPEHQAPVARPPKRKRRVKSRAKDRRTKAAAKRSAARKQDTKPNWTPPPIRTDLSAHSSKAVKPVTKKPPRPKAPKSIAGQMKVLVRCKRPCAVPAQKAYIRDSNGRPGSKHSPRVLKLLRLCAERCMER